MALMEIANYILKGYDFETKSSRAFLGFGNGTKITLKNNLTEENFFNLFSEICKLLGVPDCVHSYCGFVWKSNGEFLALNVTEESYGCDVTSLFIFRKMPFGRKVTYSDYAQTEEIVKQAFFDHDLRCSGFVHYCDRKFIFLGDSTETQCLVILKRHKMEFYCSSKETFGDGATRVIPRYSREEKISLSDISAIKQALRNCFVAD